MAMAVKSSLVIGIQTMQSECWSIMESLNTDSSWEWNNDDPRWSSVTVARSAGGSKSDEFSPVYVSAPSVESVKNEPASCLFSLGGDGEEPPDKGNGKLRRSAEESLGSSPPSKKQRGPLSPCINTLVPRCQVEGCRADLSGCKDYHKRHKVCEMHSKAPKAIAGGIEQRFCQQCSRFHLLKEFDEGKRSCRRRLAGHNERRRKPHPEPHSFFGLSNPFLHREISTSTLGGAPVYLPDVKPSSVLNPHSGSLLEFNGLHSYGHSLTRANLWPLKTRNDSIPTFQIQNPKTPMTTLKPTPGLNLGGHPHHFLEGSSLDPLGQGLSLSSSTVGGVLGSLEQQSPMESLSSVMDSGRALSLLSLQSWAPCSPPASSALAAQPGDSTLEHLVASSNESSAQFSHPSCSSTTRAQPFLIQSGGLDSRGPAFGLTATGTGTTHEQRGGCNNMLAGLGGGYHETNSMLALIHGGQALNNNAGFGRTTMDLMQTVYGSSHSNGVFNNNSSFSSVRAFESSRFSNQQLL